VDNFNFDVPPKIAAVDVDRWGVDLGVLHHHHDGGEGVVNAAEVSEAILLFVENAVVFCILGACVFYHSLYRDYAGCS
jgi:hypothetical protein